MSDADLDNALERSFAGKRMGSKVKKMLNTTSRQNTPKKNKYTI